MLVVCMNGRIGLHQQHTRNGLLYNIRNKPSKILICKEYHHLDPLILHRFQTAFYVVALKEMPENLIIDQEHEVQDYRVGIHLQYNSMQFYSITSCNCSITFSTVAFPIGALEGVLLLRMLVGTTTNLRVISALYSRPCTDCHRFIENMRS